MKPEWKDSQGEKKTKLGTEMGQIMREPPSHGEYLGFYSM